MSITEFKSAGQSQSQPDRNDGSKKKEAVFIFVYQNVQKGDKGRRLIFVYKSRRATLKVDKNRDKCVIFVYLCQSSVVADYVQILEIAVLPVRPSWRADLSGDAKLCILRAFQQLFK